MAEDGAASETGIYEALLPPLYPVSSSQRGAYVLLTAVIMIVLSGLTVAAKLQMTMSKFRKLRRDDIALLSALHYYAANILLWPSLASSKCAVALLIIAIKPPRRWIAVALYVVLGLAVAWGVAASFAVAFQCGPDRRALGPTTADSCIDQYALQIGLRVIDIISDTALCVLPAVMMTYVQVSTRNRLLVSLMFGLRIATPVLTAISLSSLAKYYNEPTRDRAYAAVDPSIWTCLALNISLLTACLPSIRRVLADWASGVSNANILQAFELQNSSSRTKTGPLSGTPRSFPASNYRSDNRSRTEHAADHTAYASYLRGGREHGGGGGTRGSEDTESKRGLTDGITQTIDYSVEVEDDGKQALGGLSGGRR